ncbi:aldo/keto reductase [Agromyces sp. SYSU T0242]|uniref:aldo/keto reductase n=1 Tax=Agromyces litoreus TaxID=3158561 RepID=UPI003392F69E
MTRRHALPAAAVAAPDRMGEPDERDPSTTTVDLETNAVSGPIPVARRAGIGETGIEAHPLALGTSAFGRRLGTAAGAAILDRFVALGGTLVDAADGAADGVGETVIGEWVRSRGAHDRIGVVAAIGRQPDGVGLAPASIARSVDASLMRLGVDRIDVLCLRDDHPEVPLEERLGAVHALVAAGKVRTVGASDLTPERLIEARVLAANGLPRFQVMTARYNLLERRGFEGATELVAHAQGIPVLAHTALAHGFLGGAVRRRSDLRREPGGDPRARHLGRRGLRVLRALDEVALAHGTVPAAVAIAWLLGRPNVVAPVAAVSRPEQVDALLAAASVELHRSEIVELDRASA